MTDVPIGIQEDRRNQRTSEQVAAHDSTLAVCSRCKGSGNEFYAMYRKCSMCDGLGVVEVEHVEGGDDE